MKTLTCECGEVIRGKDEKEVLQKGSSHVMKHHPEMLTKEGEKKMRASIREAE